MGIITLDQFREMTSVPNMNDMAALIMDEDDRVRATVAGRGYGLDELAYDESDDVREVVDVHLRARKLTLDEWIEQNPDRCFSPESRTSAEADASFEHQRCDAAAPSEAILSELAKNVDPRVRMAVAYQGYGLDELVDDVDRSVREAVAFQGYGLEKLIEDEDSEVRAAVARQGYGLDALVDDEHTNVRLAIAEQGYCLDKLVDDEDEHIRLTVARQGYGLDILIHDEVPYVRKAVRHHLNGRGITLDQWIEQNPDKCVLELS